MPFHDVDDARLHFFSSGVGSPPVVFIHGALCQHDDWRHQLDHFAVRHRVLAPDLRGHGQSRDQPGPIGVERFASDVLAMLNEQCIDEPVVLVGHSMACRVLLQLCWHAPERIAALVFVDGAYLVSSPLGEIEDRARIERADLARERANALFVGQDPADRLRVGFAGMFFDERFAAERDRVLAHAVSLPAEVPRELMPGFAAWDVMNLERTLAAVRVPVLVFACTRMDGQHERRPLRVGETTAWLDALAMHAPHAEIVRMHDAGHFPMLEQPAFINDRIHTFLAANRLSGT
ncbi:MAG: alpha/beta hydrolase [Burkholderiaceae bacterium]